MNEETKKMVDLMEIVKGVAVARMWETAFVRWVKQAHPEVVSEFVALEKVKGDL